MDQYHNKSLPIRGISGIASYSLLPSAVIFGSISIFSSLDKATVTIFSVCYYLKSEICHTRLPKSRQSSRPVWNYYALTDINSAFSNQFHIGFTAIFFTLSAIQINTVAYLISHRLRLINKTWIRVTQSYQPLIAYSLGKTL